MDGMERCAEEVRQAGGEDFTDRDARALLSLVDERAERLGREQGLSPGDAVRQAGKELADMEAAAAAKARQNALLNLVTRISRLDRIEGLASSAGKGGKLDLLHAVGNQIVAKNTPGQGNRLSAEVLWRTRLADYAGGVSVALDKLGLLKTFRNGTIERNWSRELYELSMRSAGLPDRVGSTNDAAALQIAEAVHGFQQLAKQRLNRLGAWIGDYAGYITKTAHDMDKIRRAGFNDWRGFIEPRLSSETFEGVQDRTAFLKSTWNALSTGVHLVDSEQLGLKDAAFAGPANLAARLSEGRKLHFNSADAWLDYQSQFGHGSLVEQVMGALDRSARQEALMTRWGTNPEAEFQSDFVRLAEKYRDTQGDAVVALRQGQKGLQTQFDYLTGEANRPGNQQWAEAMAGVRAIQSMAKLGGVAFTHLSSFVTKASELRYHGIGWLEGYGNSVESLLQGRGRGEARELSDLLLAGTEGMHGSMMARFGADDAPAGTVSKLTNRFFAMSGLTYMLDAQKAGMQRIMSRWLGQHVESSFAALPAQMQRTLSSYDINPAEWDALRQAPDHFTLDGRVHLTPHAAMTADAGAVVAARGSTVIPTDAATAPIRRAIKASSELTPAMVAGARDDLAVKLHALLADVADRGIITPGIQDKALLLGGARPGTLAGEALRFIAQFKTWGMAAARQGLGRELYGGQDTAGKISGIAQLALGTAAMGYLTMTLKDVFKGQTPRDPRDPRTVMAAMIQGGGYGIMGDYLFGQYSRFGQSAVESLAGPTVGTASDLLRVLDIARGAAVSDPTVQLKDAGPQLLRIAQNNTPFLNMFYARRALDYLLFHSLQESMNPGYLRRAERSMQKQTGQTYFLSPQNHLPVFGR